MKNFKDMNPTPEMQAAYDAAYEAGLRDDEIPSVVIADGGERGLALMRLSAVWGYAAGIDEYYRRKGIRTQFFSDRE